MGGFGVFTMAATMGAPKNRYYAADGDANEEDDEAKPRNVARKKRCMLICGRGYNTHIVLI